MRIYQNKLIFFIITLLLTKIVASSDGINNNKDLLMVQDLTKMVTGKAGTSTVVVNLNNIGFNENQHNNNFFKRLNNIIKAVSPSMADFFNRTQEYILFLSRNIANTNFIHKKFFKIKFWEKLFISNVYFDLFLAMVVTFAYPCSLVTQKKSLLLQVGFFVKQVICQRYFLNNENSDYFKYKVTESSPLIDHIQKNYLPIYSLALLMASSCYALGMIFFQYIRPYQKLLLIFAKRLAN